MNAVAQSIINQSNGKVQQLTLLARLSCSSSPNDRKVQVMLVSPDPSDPTGQKTLQHLYFFVCDRGIRSQNNSTGAVQTTILGAPWRCCGGGARRAL